MHLSTEESPVSWIVKLLEKLAEVFPNTFHRRSFSMNDVVKGYREKAVLKLYSWSLVLNACLGGSACGGTDQ